VFLRKWDLSLFIPKLDFWLSLFSAKNRTFLAEKLSFPRPGEEKKENTFFGKHFSAHASLNNRRTLSMAKSRPRRQLWRDMNWDSSFSMAQHMASSPPVWDVGTISLRPRHGMFLWTKE
jgi:hypothetical protein